MQIGKQKVHFCHLNQWCNLLRVFPGGRTLEVLVFNSNYSQNTPLTGTWDCHLGKSITASSKAQRNRWKSKSLHRKFYKLNETSTSRIQKREYFRQFITRHHKNVQELWQLKQQHATVQLSASRKSTGSHLILYKTFIQRQRFLLKFIPITCCSLGVVFFTVKAPWLCQGSIKAGNHQSSSGLHSAKLCSEAIGDHFIYCQQSGSQAHTKLHQGWHPALQGDPWEEATGRSELLSLPFGKETEECHRTPAANTPLLSWQEDEHPAQPADNSPALSAVPSQLL